MDLESNPALMLNANGGEFELGIRLNRARLTYQDRYIDPVDGRRNYDNRTESTIHAPLPYVGIIVPLDLI